MRISENFKKAGLGLSVLALTVVFSTLERKALADGNGEATVVAEVAPAVVEAAVRDSAAVQELIEQHAQLRAFAQEITGSASFAVGAKPSAESFKMLASKLQQAQGLAATMNTALSQKLATKSKYANEAAWAAAEAKKPLASDIASMATKKTINPDTIPANFDKKTTGAVDNASKHVDRLALMKEFSDKANALGIDPNITAHALAVVGSKELSKSYLLSNVVKCPAEWQFKQSYEALLRAIGAADGLHPGEHEKFLDLAVTAVMPLFQGETRDQVFARMKASMYTPACPMVNFRASGPIDG